VQWFLGRVESKFPVFCSFWAYGFKGKQKEIVEAAFTGMPFFEIVF